VLEVLRVAEIVKSYIVENACAKQTTIAVIVKGEKYWVGTNSCENPQKTCPRKDMPTGVGYEFCKTICKQKNHAEIDVCIRAGNNGRGGNLYLIGHYYCCEPCKLFMNKSGIKTVTILPKTWDLMITHPPCTHLAVSGARWFKDKGKEQHDALAFVRMLLTAPINRICLENPVSIISTRIRKPDQIIQPWQFGHGETKTTCLWLKNLPLLKPTNIVEGREHRIHKMPPSPERGRERSRTYQGIADAMAEQWG
jgi:hypothetical protein